MIVKTEDFSINREENGEYQFVVTRAFLEKIDRMDTVPYHVLPIRIQKEMDNKDLQSFTFDEEDFKVILKSFYYCVNNHIMSFNRDNLEKKEALDLEFMTLEKKEIESDKYYNISRYFELGFMILEDANLFYYRRDLTQYYKGIMNDLEPLCTDEEYEYFATMLQNKNYNLEDMKKVVSMAYNKIRTDWGEKITDPATYKPGDPFRFIVHSTTNTEWDDRNEVFFPSSSLITNNSWDTYSSKYGLILDPKYIVAASSKDLYTRNREKKEEDIFDTLSLPPLQSITRVENELVEIKKGLSYNYNVYSEVVTKGFNPIGVFCITNGAHLGGAIDKTYQKAKKLHKCFPELPFIEIDKTLYARCEDEKCDNLSELLHDLINDTGVSQGKLTAKYMPLYEYFIESKKNGTYDKESLKREYINMSLENKVKVK